MLFNYSLETTQAHARIVLFTAVCLNSSVLCGNLQVWFEFTRLNNECFDVTITWWIFTRKALENRNTFNFLNALQTLFNFPNRFSKQYFSHQFTVAFLPNTEIPVFKEWNSPVMRFISVNYVTLIPIITLMIINVTLLGTFAVEWSPKKPYGL